MTTSTLRFPGGSSPTTPADLSDNLANAINRCMAIADLIAAVNSSEDATVADTTITEAAYAIVSDLDDAKTMMNGWYERERAAGLEEDNLANFTSRSLIYRGVLDSVGKSHILADKIMEALDKQLAEYRHE